MTQLNVKYREQWADPVMQKTLSALLSMDSVSDVSFADANAAACLDILKEAGCLDAVTFAALVTEQNAEWKDVERMRVHFPADVFAAVEALNNVIVIGHFTQEMICDFLLTENAAAARINIARAMILPYADIPSMIDRAAPFDPVDKDAMFVFNAGLFLHMNRLMLEKESFQASSPGLMKRYLAKAREMSDTVAAIDAMDMEQVSAFQQEMKASYDALEEKWGEKPAVAAAGHVPPPPDSQYERLKATAKRRFRL